MPKARLGSHGPVQREGQGLHRDNSNGPEGNGALGAREAMGHVTREHGVPFKPDSEDMRIIVLEFERKD